MSQPILSQYDQYFLSYSGVRLPLKLVGELDQDSVAMRNTWFGAMVNEAGQPTLIHKCVYGELDLEHKYEYGEDGALKRADITDYQLDEDEQKKSLVF
ncbi:MAG: DUF6156 family protein [Oceanobacter sp.]